MEKAKLLETGMQNSGWITGVAMLCVAMLPMGCTRGTPEDALRVQLQQMEAAAGDREPRTFMDAVAEDFSGSGGMDRAALHNLLRMQFLANASVGATTGPVSIDMHGDKATVDFSVVLTGGDGRVLPDRVQSYEVTSGWRLQDGEWKVYVAEWKPIL
jgi:hypothetical protein